MANKGNCGVTSNDTTRKTIRQAGSSGITVQQGPINTPNGTKHLGGK